MVNPAFAALFRPDSKNPGDYLARSESANFMSPAFTIASAVDRRVTYDTTFDLPDTWTAQTLTKLMRHYAQLYVSIPVAANEAVNLGDVGEQLLDLNRTGNVQPPLNFIEMSAIRYLIDLVTPAEPVA